MCSELQTSLVAERAAKEAFEDRISELEAKLTQQEKTHELERRDLDRRLVDSRSEVISARDAVSLADLKRRYASFCSTYSTDTYFLPEKSSPLQKSPNPS